MFRLKYAINEPVPNRKTRKVLMIGNDIIGKSAFLKLLINQPVAHTSKNMPSACIKRHTIDDIHIDLQFINTADEARYGKKIVDANSEPDYFIAMYDTTDLESLNYINFSITAVRRKFPHKKIMLVGTKHDDAKPTSVSEQMIEAVTTLHDISSHYVISSAAIPAKNSVEYISQKIAQDLLDSSALSDDYSPPEFVINCIDKKIDEMIEDPANTFNQTERLRAGKAVTACAQALLASEGIKQFQQHQSLQQTLKLVYKVITEPQHAAHVSALKKNINSSAPGHSVLWKKLTGALTVFLGAAIIGLSAAGIPYTAGFSASGILGGMMVITAGILLFRSGMQKGVAREAERLIYRA